MAIRYYCGVPEECTQEQARPLFDKMLEKIGIKIVFMHSECGLSTTLEKTAREIDELERENPSGCNFPLQPNCLYAYTPLDGTPNQTRHPVVRLLTKTPSKLRRGGNTQFVTCTLPQEKDYKDLPVEVQKDIIFTDEGSRKEVGWYNKTANILWMADVFHYLENSKNLIPSVVEAVTEFNRYGKLPEVLTVGADPEFEVMDSGGNLVEAHSLFGEHGCTSTTEIGYDGNSATGELRPRPSRSPLGLTRNIKRLIRKLNGMRVMSDNQVFVGGGTNLTTGGHIHFGMKGVTNEFKELMWDMVAGPVLEFQSSRRKESERSNFERCGSANFREQPHGTEWRPLPSFIVNEEITAAVLSTAYAIAKSWKFYNYRHTTRPITVQSYHSIPLYTPYKKQIDTFIKYFVLKSEPVALQGKDIFPEWKIEQIKKQYTVDVISQADWLQNYFTPLNAKIKKPVKLEIRFSGDVIVTFGIKPQSAEPLAKFADEHYLPEIQVNEKMPKGQSRPLICLPSAWYHMTSKSKFCDDFRKILKDVILSIGGSL